MLTKYPEFLAQLRRGKVSLVAWPLAMGAVLSLYASVFGAMFNDIQASAQMMNSLPDAMTKLFSDQLVTSGAGFIYSVFFSLIGFVLLSIASVTWGQGLIAGLADSGELELSAARGISRQSFFFQRITAIILRILLCGIVVAIVLSAFNGSSHLDLQTGGTAVAIAGWMGHGALIVALTNLIGVYTLKRSAAIAAGASFAVWSYLTQAVGKLLDSLSWLCWCSPQYWMFRTNPLDGVELGTWWALAVIWVLALLITLATLALYQRRDLV